MAFGDRQQDSGAGCQEGSRVIREGQDRGKMVFADTEVSNYSR
jgi:hypothetical protein